jgi:hypothetical protein
MAFLFVGICQNCYAGNSYNYDISNEASLNASFSDDDSNHSLKNLNIQSDITLTNDITYPDYNIAGSDININGNHKTLDGANHEGFDFKPDSAQGTFNIYDY